MCEIKGYMCLMHHMYQVYSAIIDSITYGHVGYTIYGAILNKNSLAVKKCEANQKQGYK